MLFGDLTVVGTPPAELAHALAVIAVALHSAFDKIIQPGKSKESCVLVSLAIRDFLWAVGFKDARVTTVYLAIKALDRDGNEIHSLGVGDHDRVPTHDPHPPRDTQSRWNGHMVVTVPSAGYLIDATMFHMKRSAWQDGLPGMMAVPLGPTGGDRLFGHDVLVNIRAEQGDGSRLFLLWLDQPNPRWRGAPDTDKDRRRSVVRALLKRYREAA